MFFSCKRKDAHTFNIFLMKNWQHSSPAVGIQKTCQKKQYKNCCYASVKKRQGKCAEHLSIFLFLILNCHTIDSAVILTDLKRLEKWASRNLMKSSQGECKGLHLERSSTRKQYTGGCEDRWPSGKQLGREPPGVLLDKKLDMSQLCVPAPTTLAQGDALGKALPAGQGRQFLLHSELATNT